VHLTWPAGRDMLNSAWLVGPATQVTSYVRQKSEMTPRQWFQLSTKVVGLFLLCQGILGALTAATLFFHELDVTRLTPPSVIKGLSPDQIQGLQSVASYTWRYGMEQLFLTGIIPIVFGCYLLRAENAVVRLCYPRPDQGPPGSEPQVGPPRNTPTGEDTATDEGKYAPPGYRGGT
jgi:hypothetical protein